MRGRLWQVLFTDGLDWSSSIPVWADNESDAIDEAADWAEEHAPELALAEEDVKVNDQGNPVDEYGADVVYCGNHGRPYTSHTIHVRAVDEINAQIGESPLRPVDWTYRTLTRGSTMFCPVCTKYGCHDLAHKRRNTGVLPDEKERAFERLRESLRFLMTCENLGIIMMEIFKITGEKES